MSKEKPTERTSNEWWTKIEEVYHKARELPVEQRAVFIDEACLTDAAMRRQIDVLLQQDENADSFFNRPAVNADLATGFQLGSYRTEAKIGEGGMGVVYLARDTKLNRPVAIKLLSEDLADATA